PPSSPGAVKKAHKTYLDIPPELRRRPRPEYGGIIFAPHWEKSVGDYHLKCRIPEKIRLRMSSVSPRILLKNASTKNPEEEDHSSPSPST
ncbi:Putative LOC100877383, partial [Caligus rogercresseyi]